MLASTLNYGMKVISTNAPTPSSAVPFCPFCPGIFLDSVDEQANVVVHQFKAPRFFIPCEKAALTIHLSYHGEHHYNSVRAIGDEGNGRAMPITLQTPTSSRASSRVEGEIRVRYY